MTGSPPTSVARPRLRLSAVLLAAVALAAAACGSHSNIATVYGTVTGGGGPLSGNPPKPPRPGPLKNITVTAIRVRSSMRFETVTSHDGTFSLSLPPGTYVLEAECGRAQPPELSVAAGSHMRRNITCVFG